MAQSRPLVGQVTIKRWLIERTACRVKPLPELPGSDEPTTFQTRELIVRGFESLPTGLVNDMPFLGSTLRGPLNDWSREVRLSATGRVLSKVASESGPSTANLYSLTVDNCE